MLSTLGLATTSRVAMQRCLNRSTNLSGLDRTSSSSRLCCRWYGTTGPVQRGFKVAVAGAAGGIGQPLSLLLKLHPLVEQLALCDVAPSVVGVGLDISHINTSASTKGYCGGPDSDAIKEAMTGADIVVIPAGMPRKPGMTRDDLFGTNASILASITESVAQYAPTAMICIITNPINSLVPVAAEVMKHAGVYNERKLFGVTTLDRVRAATFVAQKQPNSDPSKLRINVVLGHAGVTILPLLGQEPTANDMSDEVLEQIVSDVMWAGDKVVEAKAGAGSATLSMAYSGYLFADAVLRALNNEHVIENAFVAHPKAPLSFFAAPLRLGPSGIEEYLPMGSLTQTEHQKFDAALGELRTQVEKGIAFGKAYVEQSRSGDTHKRQ